MGNGMIDCTLAAPKEAPFTFEMKEHETSTQTVTVAAITSQPRYGPVDGWTSVVSAICKLGIYPVRGSGAYWSHSLDKMMLMLTESDVDWVLTFDYDSLFTYDQVKHLMNRFMANHEIHALAATQARRACRTAIGLGAQNAQEQNGFLRAQSMHFGLTLLRLDALRRMPRPWFHSKPDSGGGWTGEDRLDPDVWFWKQWHDTGNTAYFDLTCNIGHIEEMVAVVRDGKVVYETMDEWYNNEAPGNRIPLR